jgi:hypothetical protein
MRPAMKLVLLGGRRSIRDPLLSLASWEALAGTPTLTGSLQASALGDWGANLLTNGDMEDGDPPTGWGAGGGATLSAVADERTGGAGAQSLSALRGTNDNAVVRQTGGLIPVGSTFAYRGWVRNVSAATGVRLHFWDSVTGSYSSNVAGTDWVESSIIAVLGGPGTSQVYCQVRGSEGQEGRFDDLSLRIQCGVFRWRKWNRSNGVFTIPLCIPETSQQSWSWLVRMSDLDNYWEVRVTPNVEGQSLSIIRVEDGAGLAIASAVVPWTAGGTDCIRISALDDVIATAYRLDGQPEWTEACAVAGADHNRYATQHGVMQWGVDDTGPYMCGTIQATASGARLDRLPELDYSLEEDTFRPLGALDGLFYAAFADGIYSSVDTQAWTKVSGKTDAVKLYRLGDGEILLHPSGGANLQKSSGWAENPMAATFDVVLTPTEGGPYFQTFGVDASANLVTAAEYGTQGIARCLWVSTDSGDTFTRVLDLHEMYPDNYGNTHFHATCIDPLTGRLWASHGDGPSGIFFSDDNGSTWTQINDVRQPTVMVAAKEGIVCGSDQSPSGLARIRRTANPANMVAEDMSIFLVGTNASFALSGERDEATGLAYVGFRAGGGLGIPARLFVSDGHYARMLLEMEESEGADETPVLGVSAVSAGLLLGMARDVGGLETRMLLRGMLR